jgi:phytoene synthase
MRDADLAACRASLANGSRTFLAASRLLPRRVRDPASALYAFCRHADDAIDGADADPDAALVVLRARLDAIYDGRAGDAAVDRALAAVVHGHGIPRVLPDALLEGFAWDAAGRRIETSDDLHDYAARVAGSVGAMMALLMGTRDAGALARACDLGVAMQLSNIARDVGEDARNGRLYLPNAWMREAGIDPDAWLAAPVHSAALAGVVRRVLDEADVLYARIDGGIARLPRGCRPGINAARRLYAAIGHAVAAQGCDAIERRAYVPARRKAALLARAVVGALVVRAGPVADAPPLAATRFLVDAAVRPWASSPLPASRRGWAARAVWTIELFERLERRDHALRAPAGAGEALS